MLKTNQGKKAGTQKKRDNPPLVVCLLFIVIILLVCVLASIAAVAYKFETQANSEDTENMKAMARDMQSVMPQIKTAVPQITSITTVMAGNDLNVTKLMNKLNDFDEFAAEIKSFMPQIKTVMPAITEFAESDDFNFTTLLRDIKTFIPQIKTIVPKVKAAMEDNDLDLTKLMSTVNDFDGLAGDVKTFIPKIKAAMPTITELVENDDFNVTTLFRDIKTFMPQIKTVVPKITTAMEGNDLNLTKLLSTVNDFDGLAGDIKTFMPNIKAAMPTITKLVENDDFNVTKLIHQLNDFDALAQDMKDATPQIKKVVDSLENTDMSKMMDKLHDFSDVVDKLQTNPMSLLLDGAFEANTDMSRWRAVALEAANILQKLTKVDYSVSVVKPTWDTVQYCDGKWDSGFDGQDKDVYKLDDKNACEDFNVNTSMFAKGFGACEWGKHDDECKSSDDDDSKKSFRWMRHAGGSRQQIIPKSASDDLQLRFAHYQKFASNFAGKQVPKLEPAAVVDFPVYLSNLMGVVQPGLLLNVVNATDFLEKQSLSSVFCEPGSGKERQNSCAWVDEGYQFAVDNSFKMIVRITRAMARNLHKAWVA